MQVRPVAHWVALVPALACALIVGSELNANDARTRSVTTLDVNVQVAIDTDLVDAHQEATGCIAGDLDCDDDVDAFDLAYLLRAFNACNGGCFGDLDDDGDVDAEDLTILLAGWTG